MNTLESVLVRAKQKYHSEIEERRLKTVRKDRKEVISRLITDYFLVNSTRIESFRIIKPDLYYKLLKDNCLLIQDYDDNTSSKKSKFMTLGFDIDNENSFIVFTFQVGVPKTSVGAPDPYDRKYVEVGKLPFNATKEEITVAYENALVESLKIYFEV